MKQLVSVFLSESLKLLKLALLTFVIKYHHPHHLLLFNLLKTSEAFLSVPVFKSFLVGVQNWKNMHLPTLDF